MFDQEEIETKFERIKSIAQYLAKDTKLKNDEKVSREIKYLAIIVENSEEINLYYKTKLKQKQIELERINTLAYVSNITKHN